MSDSRARAGVRSPGDHGGSLRHGELFPEASRSLKHQAILCALGIPPLAAIVLRNTGVISFITSEWISAIWILAVIVLSGLYYAKVFEADRK